MNINSSVTQLPKIGTSTAKIFSTLGIHSVKDLLWCLPYRYLDFSKSVSIKDAEAGQVITITGVIKSIVARRSFKSRLSLCEAIVSDNSGSIKVVWFNQSYLAKSLQSGEQIVLSGKVERYKALQMTNPIFEKVTQEQIHTGRLVPVYGASNRISNKLLRDLVHKTLVHADELEDIVPDYINQSNDLLSLAEAIKQLHFPENSEMIKRARFKIAFNDLFPKQLTAAYLKHQRQQQTAPVIKSDVEHIKNFLDTLPFIITASQKRATWDILQDISKPIPMNRLLQGDVGSGKTLVALIAALEAARNKNQTAFLAPTEILARQHYETMLEYLQGYPHNLGLITRNFQLFNNEPVTKTKYAELLSKGKIDISVGTHALLQNKLKFKNLGLIVIDEQHRFGVAQRQYLSQTSKGKHPHLLSMSATPIPRTLALTILGDLTVSTLTQVPAGRKPIITKIVSEDKRQQAYDFIRQQITAGRQAFIITPRVEENERTNLKSAKQEYEKLQKQVFPDLKVGLVYGKMKGADKDKVMSAFDRRELDVLVATSVIEIGIDIPNSSLIVIEGAERFGLAQLHQLRGRVGRGIHQSYCFLFTTSPTQQDNERLVIFSKTLNGFALAELDLEQRGFGDMFGRQQTGYSFRFPEFISMPALKVTKYSAEQLLQKDPSLKQYKDLHKEVLELINELHTE